MKKQMFLIVSCALLLLAAGCKDKEKEPESIIGNVEKPAWTAPADYDMNFSMTVVTKVDLSSNYTAEQLSAINDKMVNGQLVNENDLLAAFCGEECLGVATWQNGLFFLYVCAPTHGSNVTLKYYSSVLKNCFAATPFTFANDTRLGSVGEPFKPTWVVAK